jgi:hypothetical protein
MPVIEDVLWKNPGNPGMIVVTSHASLSQDGKLFLGYGEAREAVRRIPQIELECAKMVQKFAQGGVYGFAPIRPSRPDLHLVGFGLFQTHYAWNEAASLDLIQYSMEGLREFAGENPDLRIRMNFPGLDAGLSADQVAPILLPLPETVTICHKGELPRAVPMYFPGFKNIYLRVETLLLEGRQRQAEQYLVENGFDIQSALEQVNAVQRLLEARSPAGGWRQFIR